MLCFTCIVSIKAPLHWTGGNKRGSGSATAQHQKHAASLFFFANKNQRHGKRKEIDRETFSHVLTRSSNWRSQNWNRISKQHHWVEIPLLLPWKQTLTGQILLFFYVRAQTQGEDRDQWMDINSNHLSRLEPIWIRQKAVCCPRTWSGTQTSVQHVGAPSLPPEKKKKPHAPFALHNCTALIRVDTSRLRTFQQSSSGRRWQQRCLITPLLFMKSVWRLMQSKELSLLAAGVAHIHTNRHTHTLVFRRWLHNDYKE